MEPELAIIVVSYNTCDLLDACLASVYRHTQGVSLEVVVVDNASRDGSPAMVRRKYPQVALVESGCNLGFGRANNLGFSHTRAPFIMLLNSDAELLEDTGSGLIAFVTRDPKIGIAGPDVVLTDGTRQPKTCGMLPSARVMANQNLLLCSLFPRSRFFAGLYVETVEHEARVGWVSGVCMLLRREVYRQTQGFDPRIFMYAEDIDLCARAAAHGWTTWRLQAYAVKHRLGASTRTAADLLRMRVLQQRNLLRLTDRALGPAGRLLTRVTLALGLLMRAPLRGLAALRAGGGAQRQALQADLHCLSDFVLWRSPPGKESHAHRT